MKGLGVAGEYVKATVEAFTEVFGADLANMLGFGGMGGSDSSETAVEASGDPSGSATSASVNDPTAKALLNAIARAEGTTGSYGTMFGGAVNQDLAAGNLTVGEAMAAHTEPGGSATGRYQFMHQTFKDLINAGVWNKTKNSHQHYKIRVLCGWLRKSVVSMSQMVFPRTKWSSCLGVGIHQG